MRIYLPASLSELADPAGLGPRVVHAVTPALRVALPGEDDEGLEYAAQLLAADDSLELSGPDSAHPRRVVVAADVSDEIVAPLSDPNPDQDAPSAVQLTELVGWEQVACAHLDEQAAEPDVRATLAGDEAAAERLADRDLLWFDVTELARLAELA